MKKKSKKCDTLNPQHTVGDGVSGVTKEGCHPGVSVCLISGTGSTVREVEGVFSVFFCEIFRVNNLLATRCLIIF